ncbi:LytTR family DNA-binding domain-containing protein [Mucilaginibacter sp. OK283]|jgi:DNA-binding LytR/AlgR family response regulator|uniref:LytR/AlgR family response regulator transcription factor n=1 Tax=Mucilaginibacter sp. OK283 TaxID=1881049 RepID=UPI0008AA7FFC|nr:LytTR family DNA-binding domain-containing protein [Mucilaginibacter sp. OK283]SEP40358.1 two component transcriptional regulator, LytTR family [Mucilaginibacter sp. OK283]
MIINCIAVDDEPISLNRISSYISQTPFLKLSGRYSNALTALKAIHELPGIQLVFLDIRMPDLSGIELARIIEQSPNKQSLRIIFTTAYDQYALESYKVAALDYLLKPFNFVDFSKAVTRAQEYFAMRENQQPATQQTQAAYLAEQEYIYLKVEYQLVKVNISHILYIEGFKDYIKVYLSNEANPIFTLTSLKNLEEKLPPSNFLRIHRSFIVALDKIKSVTKNSVQINQTTIHVTEQYKEVFTHFLRTWT